MNEKDTKAYKKCYGHGYYPVMAKAETNKPECVYCGSTEHDMAYKTVFDEGRAFSCLDGVACLSRIRASINKSFNFTVKEEVVA